MRKTLAYARTSALPAIAAALALSSTPLFAQQVQTVPADPSAAATAAQQAPAATPDPAASGDQSQAQAATDASTAPNSDSAASIPAAKPATHRTHVAAAKPPAVTTRTISRSATTRVTAPAATTRTAANAPAQSPPAPAATPVSQSAVKPVVDMTAKSTQTTTTASSMPTKKPDETLPIAAGGALALIVIGGAAAMISRRRHDEEEEWVGESPMQYEPAEATVAKEPAQAPIIHEEQPAIVAPSAFAWDGARGEEPMVEDERHDGESWVERAYRGPSPSNPSVSLKNRLKRAAFFDKRERDAAAGLAEPVDPTAGLPDAMVAERERERELA